MNPILQNILQHFEGPMIATVARRLGIDEATATRAVQVAIPVILSVLAHRGASSVQGLGPNNATIAQGISQSAGITASQAQQLIGIVTPMAMQHLGTQQASPQDAAQEHAKQLAPALSSGDHQSIVKAITSLGL